jgi:Fe-S oxidoreductase
VLPEDVRLKEGARVAYFAGCTSSYLHPDIAVNTGRILNAGGLDFTVMGADEYCCGAPLWRTGQIEAARKLAEYNLEILKKEGIKTLIASCAECYGTFKGFYPRIAELDFEVLHISEVIDTMLQQGKLKLTKKSDLKVTYHDPCLLGRLSELYVPWNGVIRPFGLHDPPKQWRRGTYGVYAAPRRILQSIPGLELVEMIRSEENAFCCGGGGGVPAVFPEFAQWTAAERLSEVASTGADSVISCCPFCQSSFESAIGSAKSKIGYHDLTELVIKAI